MNYVILHDPHSSPHLDDASDFIIDPQAEIDRVTDWYVSDLFRADQVVRFPWSKLCHNVVRGGPCGEAAESEQRLIPTYTGGGRQLRETPSPARLGVAIAERDRHHLQLATLIASTSPYMPVVLIDGHSFSDEQATTMNMDAYSPKPDVMLSWSRDSPLAVAVALKTMFETAGFAASMYPDYADPYSLRMLDRSQDLCHVSISLNKRLYLADPYRSAIDPAGFARTSAILGQVYELLASSDV